MSQPDHAARRGALLSVTSTALGAAYLVPYKLAGKLAPPLAIVAIMLAAAALFNTIIAVAQRGRQLRIDRVTLGCGLALAVFTVVGNICVLISLRTLQPAITSVLTHTQLFFVVAIAWPLLGERPTFRFTVGVAVVVGGLALMRMRGDGDVQVSAVGIACALTAASCWASMHVVTRRHADRLQPPVVNALRLWIATGSLLVYPGTLAEIAGAPAQAWLYAAAAAFLGPFASRVLLMYSVRFLTASRTVLIEMIGPVFAFVFAFAAFREVPTPYQIAGGVVIILGVALPLFEVTRADR